MGITLITPPAVEPVLVADISEALAYGPYASLDATTQAFLASRVQPIIAAARDACENYLRRVLITQTWQLQLDGFPGYDTRYSRSGYSAIVLPKVPFQSISFFKYVDTGGVLQTLVQDTTYGVSPVNYGYQLDAGSGTQPARLMPPFARPWPPTRMVPNNVIVQFVAGHGVSGASVPPGILMAIRAMTEFLYKQGGMQDAPMPAVVTRLLDPYRNLVA